MKQVVYVIQAKDKFTVLFNHIALHPEARTIVFCNRKSTTEDVYDSLRVRGVSVEMLSGDVNQNKRLKVLDAFDKRIAGKILDAHRACVLMLNKWDLALEKGITSEKKAAEAVRKMMPFLNFAPIVFCSNKSGYNIRRTVEAIDRAAASASERIA